MKIVLKLLINVFLFISIGVAPPHLHLEDRKKERDLYESKLKEKGADLILNSVNDLININLEFL